MTEPSDPPLLPIRRRDRIEATLLFVVIWATFGYVGYCLLRLVVPSLDRWIMSVVHHGLSWIDWLRSLLWS